VFWSRFSSPWRCRSRRCRWIVSSVRILREDTERSRFQRQRKGAMSGTTPCGSRFLCRSRCGEHLGGIGPLNQTGGPPLVVFAPGTRPQPLLQEVADFLKCRRDCTEVQARLHILHEPYVLGLETRKGRRAGHAEAGHAARGGRLGRQLLAGGFATSPRPSDMRGRACAALLLVGFVWSPRALMEWITEAPFGAHRTLTHSDRQRHGNARRTAPRERSPSWRGRAVRRRS
jgi:hypothetical protein